MHDCRHTCQDAVTNYIIVSEKLEEAATKDEVDIVDELVTKDKEVGMFVATTIAPENTLLTLENLEQNEKEANFN